MMMPRITLAYSFPTATEYVSEAYVTAKRLDRFFKTPEKREEHGGSAEAERGMTEIRQGSFGWYGQSHASSSASKKTPRDSGEKQVRYLSPLVDDVA